VAGYDLQLLRSHLPVLREWTYLNTGTVGIMPDPVFDELMSIMRAYEQGGHTSQRVAVEGAERAKATLGSILGVPGDQIALNRNATDGINTIAAGFPLSPGDEVITSTEEHPAMVLPWLAACDRSGARLRFVEVSPDPEVFRSNLQNVLSDATRIVAVSHVSCETGTRIPVHVIREAVGPDVAILIDASQSVGQFPFSIADFRADFVIGNGHKWLAGPKGTGFVWFSPGSLDKAEPVYFASDTFDPPWSRAHYQQEPNPAIKYANTASRYEMGTRAWHLHAGLTAAIEYQAALGWEAIESHIAAMSTLVKQELSKIPGVTLHSPLEWEASSGLVTFSIEGMSGEEASAALWEDYRIAQRRVECPSAVRISCAYFMDDEDISKVVAAVANLAS
jgi:selenocysteine lyase/cysteine desulfurase